MSYRARSTRGGPGLAVAWFVALGLSAGVVASAHADAPADPALLRARGRQAEPPAGTGGQAPLPPEKGLPAPDGPRITAPPPGVMDAGAASLPVVIWPEARFQKRFGLHEIDVRGHSYGYQDGAAGWALPVPGSGGDVSVTYRYHGLLGGIVRPVAGLALMAGETFAPAHPASGVHPTQAAVLLPTAGLEVVYEGVGVGWRAGVPLWTWTSQQGFYHPQLGGPPSPGWRQLLLESLIQGLYPVWER